ncbi:MAG TPA: site-specific DNA-methyltransferase [Dehalococcoidia bacterium]|nr:site-specific DNA-methyltransferase [Dehalococcoidia bacterium]
MEIFREVWRVLKDEGSFWLVMGDTYAGSGCGWSKHGGTVGIHSIDTRDPGIWPKGRPPQFISSSRYPVMRPKQKMLIPDRVAMALQQDGWLLRNDCIWHKPNSMPASVKDRLSNTFEHIFHFVKRERYYYHLDAIREPHKTSSLERYQRGLNQKAGLGRAYQGKHKGREAQTNREGGTLGSAVREGVSCHPPQWFQEMFPPDTRYKGKFDDLAELQVKRPGSRANNLNLKVAHQNRNFMSYKPRNFDLLSEEDKVRVLEALEAGLRVDIVTKATAASIRAHDSGRAREIAEKGYAIYINHPRGRNPGDVIHAGTRQFSKKWRKETGEPSASQEERLALYHPLGRNPGDVLAPAQDKYQQAIEEGKDYRPPHWPGNSRTGAAVSSAYSRECPGHPLGKNPGDILFADERGKLGAERQVMEESGYVNQHSGYMLAGLKIKSRLGIDIRHPLGKNPGDLIEAGERLGVDAQPGGKGRPRAGLDIPHQNHPLGRNPGDVMGRHHGSGPQYKLSGLRRGQKYVENPQPGSRSHIRMGAELTQAAEDNLHPLGRNPGDVAHLADGLGLPLDTDSLFCDYIMRLIAEKERAKQEGREPDFWSVNTQPYPEAHFAVFPEEICRKPILATCPPGGTVLDPFCGSGTVLAMARRLGRKAIGIDIVEKYCELAARRCQQQVLPLGAGEGGDRS